MRQSKKCEICGKLFIPHWKEQTCSRICGGKLKSKHYSFIQECVICGKKIRIIKALLGKIKTCGKQCSLLRKKQFRHTKKHRLLLSKLAKKQGFGKWMTGRTTSEKQKQIASEQWKGSKNPRWKPIGSRHLIGGRYWAIKIKERQWVRENVYLMEQHLGRKLKLNEIVHHIDDNKMNNRIENLQLLTKTEHKKLHGKEAWKSNPKFNRKLKCLRSK